MEREKVTLTKTVVDGLNYTRTDNGAQYVWDSAIPGFGARVFPSGRVAFLVSYRHQGRRRFFTLGTHGKDMTVGQARKAAMGALGDVARGTDPAEKREQERRGETVADLGREYMSQHGNAKKSASADQRRIDQHILPKWRTRKASAITGRDVLLMHRGIGKDHPYEANRTLALLSKMFELARRWGFVPDGHPNPARDIDRFKEHKRDRWVSPAELPRLAKAINEEPNESARNGIWLYLLLGARKTELLTARWDHVDWDRKELKLPDTKAGRVHYIPLSGPAVALLRAIPRTENPYILPGRGPRTTPVDGKAHPTHLVNISKPWNRVREAATLACWRDDPTASALIERLAAAKSAAPSVSEIRAAAIAEGVELPPAIDDVRLHDLRRTVGSWLAQAGNSLHLIGRVLNHSNQSTTAVYARFGEDSVRAALEQHGARIMGAAGLTPSADVTDLKTARKA